VSHNPFGYAIEHSQSDETQAQVSIDLEHDSDFRRLRAEVKRLADLVNAQQESLSELWQIIEQARQNNSGQRGFQDTDYWKET
jgi:multidrug efflux pump subunit AcrB